MQNTLSDTLKTGSHQITQRLSPGFPDSMVIIDCETTGGKAAVDRIIEIGLIVVHDGKLIEHWQSLINPKCDIPVKIQRLTGINPQDIKDAPYFEDVAHILFDKLKGQVLVAHNARFDYSFIAQEFERIGLEFREPSLCSVKISKSLFPEYQRHRLDDIIRRFSLTNKERHRALADAQSIFDFFEKITKILDKDDIESTCQTLLKKTSIPSKLNPEMVKSLPNTPGVYYFYDDHQRLLYIGKSVHIRTRILSHFCQIKQSAKAAAMIKQIAHIDFKETPSDFGAQLLESQEIKSLYPLYNARLRKVRKLHRCQLVFNEQGYLTVEIQAVTSNYDSIDRQIGLFRNQKQALNKIEKLANDFNLCFKVLGLEKSRASQDPCFRKQLKKCFGACCGLESAASYNERMQMAFKEYHRKIWPWQDAIVVEEQGLSRSEQSIYHLIYQWQYIARLKYPEDIHDYGLVLKQPKALNSSNNFHDRTYARSTQKKPSENHDIDHRFSTSCFDLDAYFILVRFLLNNTAMKINRLKVWPLEKTENDDEYQIN